jgi:hypothetical protein
LPRWWCQIPPPPPETAFFFHRQADSHYASNLNHKVYSVMRIEDKEKPAYLLGYAYFLTLLRNSWHKSWISISRGILKGRGKI